MQISLPTHTGGDPEGTTGSGSSMSGGVDDAAGVRVGRGTGRPP
jgi:hypothetical protein